MIIFLSLINRFIFTLMNGLETWSKYIIYGIDFFVQSFEIPNTECYMYKLYLCQHIYTRLYKENNDNRVRPTLCQKYMYQSDNGLKVEFTTLSMHNHKLQRSAFISIDWLPFLRYNNVECYSFQISNFFLDFT